MADDDFSQNRGYIEKATGADKSAPTGDWGRLFIYKLVLGRSFAALRMTKGGGRITKGDGAIKKIAWYKKDRVVSGWPDN
jgi:hypothetical protein